jgi:tyrosyl-tRNA synthetase
VTPSTSVAEALVQTGLCSSVSEARRAIAQGGVSINNNTVVEETAELGERQAPSDVALLLKRGKKTLAALFFV